MASHGIDTGVIEGFGVCALQGIRPLAYIRLRHAPTPHGIKKINNNKQNINIFTVFCLLLFIFFKIINMI